MKVISLKKVGKQSLGAPLFTKTVTRQSPVSELPSSELTPSGWFSFAPSID